MTRTKKRYEDVSRQSVYFTHVFLSLFLFHFPSCFISQGVDDLLGGDDGERDEADDEEEAEEGSVAPSIRSPSPVPLNGPSPTPDLLNTDGTLMLFPGNSCSRTGSVGLYLWQETNSVLFIFVLRFRCMSYSFTCLHVCSFLVMA